MHIGKKEMLILWICLENPREYTELLIGPVRGEGAGPRSPGPSRLYVQIEADFQNSHLGTLYMYSTKLSLLLFEKLSF